MPYIFHLVEQHPTNDPRISRARQSWSTLYNHGEMIPIHVKDCELNARHLGDKRDLPMLRLILARGRKVAKPDDLIVLTNSDSLLHPTLLLFLRQLRQPAACSFRVNINGPVAINLPPAILARRYRPDYGRDLFVFTGAWLGEHWKDIPDCFLGELEFDLILAVLIRRSMGIETKTTRDFHTLTKAELPLGYVLHERHAASWLNPINLESPAKLWNKTMARAWYEDHGLQQLYTLG